MEKRSVEITDSTLKEYTGSGFRDRLEALRLIVSAGVDAVALGTVPAGEKGTALFCRTAGALAGGCALSVEVCDEASVDAAVSALSGAERPRLSVSLPLSTVQSEYFYHKKPDVMTETARALTEYAAKSGFDIEFRALDATRADTAVLERTKAAVAEAGATCFVVCDAAGETLPGEWAELVGLLLPAGGIPVGVECCDKYGLAGAGAIAAVGAGASRVECSQKGCGTPLCSFAELLAARSDAVGAGTRLDMTKLRHTSEKVVKTLSRESGPQSPFGVLPGHREDSDIPSDAGFETVSDAVAMLGYDLSYDDLISVYSSFGRLAEQTGKGSVSARELDAIVASSAMQVAPTYKLDTYVINSGNTIRSTAFITLDRKGEKLTGICAGDGPIDAAFLAIEQIIGRHYELDDFQIQAVTEGREAMGDALVRLRSEGGLFSGKGLSTDIIGASIMAYLSALNKIAYAQE